LFSNGKGIADLDAEVSNGTFNLSVAKQELHGPQVARPAVDQRSLGSA
jgi:hypothetical protein